MSENKHCSVGVLALLGGSPLDSLVGDAEGRGEGDGEEEDAELNRRASQVNFDIKQFPAENKAKATISRDPTPFPKELHTKAMQWRASRAAVIAGSAAGAEGGVTRRAHSVGKTLQNRESLLTALANPLDVGLLVCMTQHISWHC